MHFQTKELLQLFRKFLKELRKPAMLKTKNDLIQLDEQAHAVWARIWSSLSPESKLLAWTDWSSHLATSPGKRLELLRLAFLYLGELRLYLQGYFASVPAQTHEQEAEQILPIKGDPRFKDFAWKQWPFNLWHQSFLMAQEWWCHATHDVWGVDRHHLASVAFGARQCLDVFSPSNWLLSNPIVINRTLQEQGANLLRGLTYFLEDVERHQMGKPPAGAENFVVGRDVAVTPGKVVLRNRVMELIQYGPTTEKVHPEPILIVPAWIMKYYILDLSPHNSLIKYLVDQGYTVFCISWKNPGTAERDLGMDDYLQQGFFAALEAVNAIVPQRKVHATGYCLGGTLLAIACAAMARDGDDRLASMSLFTAQTDFTEPGELGLYIDESQVAMLEAKMAQTGYLSGHQMSGAFQMLRSNDLLWSRLLNEYLLGERRPMNDLMAWNADVTRLPERMHSQYLRQFFLNDALSEGRYVVGDRPVALPDISTPVFSVATLTDHVAPWRSVHKLHYLTPTEIHFVLTSGGHNAGIVSEPGRPRRSYHALTRAAGGNYVAPDEWLQMAPHHEGSWWPEWTAWLQVRSGAPVRPPRMGAASKGYKVLCDAPGEYVMEK